MDALLLLVLDQPAEPNPSFKNIKDGCPDERNKATRAVFDYFTELERDKTAPNRAVKVIFEVISILAFWRIVHRALEHPTISFNENAPKPGKTLLKSIGRACGNYIRNSSRFTKETSGMTIAKQKIGDRAAIDRWIAENAGKKMTIAFLAPPGSGKTMFQNYICGKLDNVKVLSTDDGQSMDYIRAEIEQHVSGCLVVDMTVPPLCIIPKLVDAPARVRFLVTTNPAGGGADQVLLTTDMPRSSLSDLTHLKNVVTPRIRASEDILRLLSTTHCLVADVLEPTGDILETLILTNPPQIQMVLRGN